MRTGSIAIGVGWKASMSVLALLVAAAPAYAELPIGSTVMSDVAERVTPAVVNITTRRNRKGPDLEKHPMLREFFGQPPRGRIPPEMGAGSGVVISADGYVVTNNHVIEGADEIKVTLANKREFPAKLIGADKPSDIALLKIDGKKLPHVDFGDSSKLRLGEIVLAVGNPFGVGQTVTMGIVSAKGRANVGIVDYEDFIQTDAAINPGNSGGALVNLAGELVGINTAILSRSGGAQGIGFAVPSNMVRPIRDQIAKYGRVRRGWLGVAIQDLTPTIARSLKLRGKQGVLVSDVLDGPANGKLEPSDVIVSVDGKPTRTAAQLRNRIALARPGSPTKLTVLRNGRKKDITLVLEEKDDENAVATTRQRRYSILGGLEVDVLTADLRERLRVPARVKGVVVSSVKANSAAERSGLEEGDIITAVDREPVLTVRGFQKAVPKKASEILLRVYKYKRGVFTFVVLRK